MATCIHGTHWDGVGVFWCPQCAMCTPKSLPPFTFAMVVPEEPSWEDRTDEWTERVRASFPTRSGSHEEYALAMRMVGNRHSKSELVALVNWLLVERRDARQKTLGEVAECENAARRMCR
jgi:hypothetical protein